MVAAVHLHRKEIARRLKDIPLATSFRSAYAYDNVLYLVAGEVIEAVSGQSWEDFVAARILKKVGMAAATCATRTPLAAGNVATPHAPIDGKVGRSSRSTATTRIRPAASTRTPRTWRSG